MNSMSCSYADGCSFCREMGGKPEESRFSKLIHDDLDRRFLWKTENFVVVPGIGHLTHGYVLVRSRSHYLSICSLPPVLIAELTQLRNDVATTLGRIFNSDVISFEHGSVSETRKGAGCTDHMHLHILPVPALLKPRLSAMVELKRINGFEDLYAYRDAGTPYVFYAENLSDQFVFESTLLPKQFMRRIVASAFGREMDWDWRQGVDTEGRAIEPQLLETIEMIERSRCAESKL